jgi:accessory gene regulator B
MSFIEILSDKIAYNISLSLELNNDDRDIIAYGVITLILTIWSIMWVIVFGVLFKVLVEALLFSFSSAILRKFSGGGHATSPNRCVIIGTTIPVIYSVFINYTYKFLNSNMISFLIILLIVIGYLIIIKLAPRDTPAKPIQLDMIGRLKNLSLRIMIIYSIIISIILLLNIKYNNDILLKYAECICGGIIFQCFTLTNYGFDLIKKIDRILKYII